MLKEIYLPIGKRIYQKRANMNEVKEIKYNKVCKS